MMNSNQFVGNLNAIVKDLIDLVVLILDNKLMNNTYLLHNPIISTQKRIKGVGKPKIKTS